MRTLATWAQLPAVTSGVQLHAVRGGQHIDAIGSFVADAARRGDHVWAEVFRLDHSGVRDALEAVAARGGLTAVADAREAMPMLERIGARGGVDAASYSAAGLREGGHAPLVQHAKGWATMDELLMTTASPHGNGLGQVNVTMRLGRDQAEGFRAVVGTGAAGSREARESALELSRLRGVPFNDPEIGVAHLDEAMLQVIRGARERLDVTPKEFLDVSWARELVAARARGVDVRTVTRQIDDESWRVLRDAGIPVSPMRMTAVPGMWRSEAADRLTWRRLHFTAVSADGGERIVVGTRYFFAPTKPGERLAREVGVVLGGAPGREAHEHVSGLLTARATARDAVGLLTGR